MDHVDDEMQGKHGTTVSDASMTEEADPENKAQDLEQVKDKVKAESSREGGGVKGALKGVLHHLDRDIAGEYERREDPDATPRPRQATPEKRRPGA
jgi:hypothetical protein